MIRKLLSRLLSRHLSARAKRIRSDAAKAYRVESRKAFYLERLAKKHQRIAGPKLLSTAPQPVEARKKSGLCVPRVREILGKISLQPN
jgi:hypothetical protein